MDLNPEQERSKTDQDVLDGQALASDDPSRIEVDAAPLEPLYPSNAY